jgi:hypothetical protein
LSRRGASLQRQTSAHSLRSAPRLGGALLIVALACTAALAPSASALAPEVVKSSVPVVREASAVLAASVSTGQKVSTYQFEYGAVDCAVGPCVKTPPTQIPAGVAPVDLKAEITGLTPGATYHSRIVVSNKDGADQSDDIVFTTHQTPSPFGPCPNDALRLKNPMAEFLDYSSAGLPDCRAFEQATPVLKNGLDAKGMVSWVKASEDGDAISFLATNGIPGGEGAQQELPAWLSMRKGGGWSTQGMMPPASLGQEVRVRGWLPDFSEIFSFARRLGPPEQSGFFAQSTSDRSLSDIFPFGPATGTFPSYAGASEDGSLVVFEYISALAPGAVAGKPNVYAWDRETDQLHLVSRLPDKDCSPAPCGPKAGAFAGPYSWMESSTPALEGDEATQSGGSRTNHYVQDMHTVSAAGDRIYFTAADTGQLYMRVNPTAQQSPVDLSGKCTDPAKGCTVRVSTSQKTNGKGPGNTDAAGPRPAAFMAASKDGSVAYFTSPEKLTNDANTGPEQKAPTIAEAEIDGDPVKLDFLPATAAGVAVDATHIYWADPTKDAIGRAEIDGENPDPDFIDLPEIETETDPVDKPGVKVPFQANPQYVTVEGTEIFWTNATDGKDTHGTIGRAKLGLTEAEGVEQDYVTGAHDPQGIAVNATHVFWSNAGEKIPTRTIGRAVKGPAEGEGVEQGFIPVDSDASALIPRGLGVNPTHIYVAMTGFGQGSYVVRYDLNGAPSSEKFIFDDLKVEIRGIALDANFVYWAREGKDSIGRINLALEKSSANPTFIPNAGHPFGLAASTTSLYWSANQEVQPNPGNDLYRFDAETGELSDVAPLATGNGAEVKGVLGASEGGSDVYFVANGVLAGGASAGDCKGTLHPNVSLNYGGQCNLYLARKGQPLAFIARLDGDGGDTDSDAANWIPRAGPSDTVLKTSRVSADGQTLLFRSQQKLTAYDNKGTAELYRFKVGEGISCVSCNPTGLPPSGVPGFGSIGMTYLFPPVIASSLSRNLSADGNRVFFETTDALVAGDANGDNGCLLKGLERFKFPICQDVYEWEAAGTGSCETGAPGGGCLYLLSSGKSPEASFFADASVSGNEAFLITSSRLVGQDQDQLYDVYDASVNGGLASQNQPPPPICTSTDACQGPPPPAPEPPTRTTNEPRPGNPKAKATSCPKGKRKVHTKGKVRCVAKGKGKKGKARAANKSRGASR